MTETARVARLLSRQLTESRQYGDAPIETSEISGGFLLTLPLLDAEVFLFLDDRDGYIAAAMTYLVDRKGKGQSTHLNNWFRSHKKEQESVPGLARAIWAKLYEDEKENEQLRRVLWMHGPSLPSLEEDVPVQQTLIFQPTPVPPASSTPKMLRREEVPADIFEMFG